jgi:2-phosphoglycerate kinase
MGDARVVLIGGTSNTGKSSVAQVVAERLEFTYRSTDGLARHPGRPWRTPGWEVPGHVAEHYRTLTVEELVSSVLDHYERLWPRIEELIAQHTGAQGGLVLEGSALWPTHVAALTLTVPGTAAVWLTAEDTVVRARVHEAGRYARATAEERHLMDKFLARSARYQSLMRAELATLGLNPARVVDAGDGRSVEAVADAVLGAVR